MPKRKTYHQYDSEIISLYHKGFSTHQIGKKFNTSSRTIRTRLDKNKIKRRDRLAQLRKYNEHRIRNAEGVTVHNGYYYITTGPHKGKRLHRVLMEMHTGITLSRDDQVHHKNGIKTDNRLENLQIMSTSDHSKLHWRIRNGKLMR